jgi:mono/diheme cytochrome c family protein
MPAYRSLFDGSPDRPRQEARDLVAYLDSLGRAREIAGPEGEAAARSNCACPDDEMLQMAFSAPMLNPHPARARRADDVPRLSATGDLVRGEALYASNCASCHGSHGEGNGAGAAALRPRPANLAEHEYALTRLAEVLWQGSIGTAMPAWRDHQVDDLASIAHIVRSFHVPAEEPPPPPALAELGARVYAENCVQCHGPAGGADGPAIAELRVAPTNFRRVRPSLAESLRALRSGVDGTQMAPWTDRLSDAELVAVAYHVRGLFEADRPPGEGASR